MPWNHPNSPPAKPKKQNRFRTCLIFSSLVFILVAGLIVFFSNSNRSITAFETPTKTKEIKRIGKRSLSNPTNSYSALSTAKVVPEKKPRTYIDDSGIERYEGGLRVYNGGADVSDLRPGARKLFKNIAETQISHLFTIRPGALVLGNKKYGDKFVKDFLRCVDEPMLYDKNDTEGDRELRMMVHEAKRTLKEAYDRGEDIAQIMTESRLELQRLANYKRQIEKMVIEAVGAEDCTKEDVSDYITAANKLLEEKGSAPLKANVLVRKILNSTKMRSKE